jgi:hypothetical protein
MLAFLAPAKKKQTNGVELKKMGVEKKLKTEN